jgi:hypothetical protein
MLIATNNRFTPDAIDLQNVLNNLLSWDYPKNNNLKTKTTLIVSVTCLTTRPLLKRQVVSLRCNFTKN